MFDSEDGTGFPETTGIVLILAAIGFLCLSLLLATRLRISGEMNPPFSGLLVDSLSISAGLLATFGVLAAYKNSWKPITPKNSLLFIGTALIFPAIPGLYRIAVTGGPELYAIFLDTTGGLMFSSIWILVGSVHKRGNHSLLRSVVALESIYMVLAYLVNESVIAAVLAPIALTVLGVPMYVFGYVSTKG